jgi:hypothetical protein
MGSPTDPSKVSGSGPPAANLEQFGGGRENRPHCRATNAALPDGFGRIPAHQPVLICMALVKCVGNDGKNGKIFT